MRAKDANFTARCASDGRTYRLGPDELADVPLAGRLGVTSGLVVPVRTQEGVLLGSMSLVWDAQSTRRPDDEAVALALADLAAAHLAGEPPSRLAADVAALRALAASEARFRTFMDAAPATAWIKDSAGRYEYVNAVFERLWRMPAPSVIGRSDRELFAPEVAEATVRRDEEVLRTGQAARLERDLAMPDGHVQTFLSIKFQLLGQNGLPGTGGMAFDITERKAADLEEAQRKARWRALVEHSPVGIFESNPQGRTTYANARFRELAGMPADEAMSSAGASRFLHREDREAVYAAWRSAIESGRELAIDYRFVHPDGTVRWVRGASAPVRDDAGLVLGWIGTVTDLTETHEALERLRRSEQNFRVVVESSGEGIGVHRDGTILYVNRALQRIFDGAVCAGPEAYVGRSLLELAAPEEWERIKARVAETTAGATPSGPLELRGRTLDGRLRTIEATAARIEYDGGPAAVVVLRDITDRKELLARLQLADRLASVGTLAAGVAHEINNPLACVVANLEQLAEEVHDLGGGSPSRRLLALEELVREASQGADRIRRIVRGMKTMARAGEPERRVPVDVNEALELAVSLSTHEIHRRARLERDLGAPPAVLADETRLAQVFVNLLVNAAQALPEGDSAKHVIRIRSGADPSGRALVEVSDSGPGIPAGILGRVFDPFFTTKQIGEGTGLGLSICHGIVTSLGGEIGVESEPGRGTTIRVLLPPAAAAVAPVAPPPSARAAPELGRPRGRALVVDDDRAVGRAVKRLLDAELEAVVVENGEAALAALASPGRFDVVFCDLMMPDMSGMELYGAVEARFPEYCARIVFVTGGAFSSAARAFLDAVPNQRLEKPVDGAELRAIARSFLS